MKRRSLFAGAAALFTVAVAPKMARTSIVPIRYIGAEALKTARSDFWSLCSYDMYRQAWEIRSPFGKLILTDETLERLQTTPEMVLKGMRLAYHERDVSHTPF